MLPDKFAVIFDGGSNRDTNYVTISATCPPNQPAEYDWLPTALLPMGEDVSQHALEYYKLVWFV